MRSRTTKIFGSVAADALVAGGITMSPLGAQDEAQAAVCGYSVETQNYDSIVQINLPIIGSVDAFGGERRVAHYGHCGDGNVKIKVETENDGNQEKCVTPGDTVLGFTENGPKIKFASAIGAC